MLTPRFFPNTESVPSVLKLQCSPNLRFGPHASLSPQHRVRPLCAKIAVLSFISLTLSHTESTPFLKRGLALPRPDTYGQGQ